MRAIVFDGVGQPLRVIDAPRPEPGPRELLLRVAACGVCRTDLHIRDGDLDDPKLPLVLGHQIVARVAAVGAGAVGFEEGDRVGVPWLAHTCRTCSYCQSDRENLCDAARFTGYHRDGGFAEWTVADSAYCIRIAGDFPDAHAAPLLCAGLIGYRSLRMAGAGARLGLYGFGASAHIVLQLAAHEGREVSVFTRPGDVAGQKFAAQLGASWVGGSDERPPQPLDAAIVFAPVGDLVPVALRALAKGGTVICAGIHMSDIPSFPYADLWGERSIRSVANLTRRDGVDFFELLSRVPIRTEVETFPLECASDALDRLAAGNVRGAAVLVP